MTATTPRRTSRRAKPMGELLTPTEVAAMFRVDPKTVTRWAQAGKLSSVRTLGNHRRFDRTEVEALLRDRFTARDDHDKGHVAVQLVVGMLVFIAALPLIWAATTTLYTHAPAVWLLLVVGLVVWLTLVGIPSLRRAGATLDADIEAASHCEDERFWLGYGCTSEDTSLRGEPIDATDVEREEKYAAEGWTVTDSGYLMNRGGLPSRNDSLGPFIDGNGRPRAAGLTARPCPRCDTVVEVRHGVIGWHDESSTGGTCPMSSATLADQLDDAARRGAL